MKSVTESYIFILETCAVPGTLYAFSIYFFGEVTENDLSFRSMCIVPSHSAVTIYLLVYMT